MADGPHILIVRAPYYEEITEELTLGTTEALAASGATFEQLDVPGAFEIPAAIALASASTDPAYDGYVALGCVIRGETTHYDYVCGESARGLQTLAFADGLAIGYGILTVENRDQAWARAARDQKNKGRDAAEAALRMIELRKRFGAA